MFVIAMDALSTVFSKASNEGLLSPFHDISSMQRLSIYADDVAMFVKLARHDLLLVREVLQAFGMASGLTINFNKSMAVLFRGDEENRNRIVNILQCPLGEFPCR